MCCFTHAHLDKYPGTVAADVRLRCRCAAQDPPCPRQATQEDMMCDWCSGRARDDDAPRIETARDVMESLGRRYPPLAGRRVTMRGRMYEDDAPLPAEMWNRAGNLADMEVEIRGLWQSDPQPPPLPTEEP